MSRLRLAVTVLVGCGILLGVAAGGSAATPAARGDAAVSAISCPAPGDCVAGGYYAPAGGYAAPGSAHAFVDAATNGQWRKPVAVRGMEKLTPGGAGSVDMISCSARGECAAGGSFVDGRGFRQAFVVSESGGKWGRAIEVPGTKTLASDGDARLDSISCAAAGACAAGGTYTDRHGNHQAFVVDETAGTWGRAITVPGTAPLNKGGVAETYSVSCSAAGECLAGGFYTGGGPAYHAHAFVVSETHGSWGTAIEAPGTAALDSGGLAKVTSVFCAAAGDCAAGGYYTDGAGNPQAFVAGETNGSWDDAIEVPGTATLNAGGAATVSSISCPAAGECAVAGAYTDASDSQQIFVESETSGSWGDATELPGLGKITSDGGGAEVAAIACAAPGDCAVGGQTVSCCDFAPFVAGETNGSWSDATIVAGAESDYGDGGVSAVACAPAGACTGGGYYVGGSHYYSIPFVTDETDAGWTRAIHLSGFPVSCLVPDVVGKPLAAAKAKLERANCRLGAIAYASSNAQEGLVVAEKPKPGKLLRPGAAVALTVSRGTAK